ncbi:ECF transporter S component [Veillonella caviae]|uniref:ECF transporter S component n=1 Tax=Veillonella caviae TaxID=248316 RepID=UPI0023F09FF7|nr:ECF transporter S component [Veillonella caviae]MCI6407946.1 ECF transporter S component [Veillonella caviae]MCI7693828.1 ECF transporter S component [Veillonella caviae]MDY5254077.1 ECF transporter S component [Veillonella caviae]MDY5409548.1 ECF transporter S component [Veillonella caviae]MDY5787318.1 ECF transporter S component [Veillonella caviae]
MQHVQTRSTTSALVLTAVLIALATLLTMYTKIPVPGIRGYFNIGDVVIMTSALLLGRKKGAYIGAIGPALADLFLGYAVFVPITFVVKGIEGYLVGTLYNKDGYGSALLATIAGGVIIVAGYFIAEYFVMDPGVAFGGLLTNTIQAVMSVIISMILYTILRKRLG